METIKAIYTRRSVRNFEEGEIPDEDIIRVLRAGMSAPSAVDVRPWSFIVIKNKHTLQKLANKLPHAKMAKDAIVGIVVCGITDKDEIYSKKYWVQDCSAATQNILLAIHDLGYGAVWTGVYPKEEKIAILREVLEIPENVIPLNFIPVGMSAEEKEAKNKFEKENIHYEKW